MASLPPGISYGTLTWQCISAVADTTADSDRNPDAQIIPGLRAVFTPSLKFVKDLATPTTVFLDPIIAKFDKDGFMLGGDMQRGVKLVASNSPAVGSDDLYYTMTMTGNTIQPMTFNVRVQSNKTYDLTKAVI